MKPAVHLAPHTETTYGVSDLVEEFSKPKPKDDKPLRFSLNNIRFSGGSVDFDDRPKRTKHAVRDVPIGIPFLSNIPSKVEITTQPAFEAKVNGAPFALHGKTKPFSASRETTLDLNLEDVDIPFYLAYVPGDIPSKVRSARLDAKLVLAFTQPAAGDPALVVSGTAALRKVAVELEKKPLLAFERFEADAEAIDRHPFRCAEQAAVHWRRTELASMAARAHVASVLAISADGSVLVTAPLHERLQWGDPGQAFKLLKPVR